MSDLPPNKWYLFDSQTKLNNLHSCNDIFSDCWNEILEKIFPGCITSKLFLDWPRIT